MSSGVLAHTTKISLFLMFVAVFMAHQIKHWGLSITISLEGCTHRLVDVGNRIHTRNDSDEDVRGYVCKCIPFRGLRYACPRLPTSAKPMCIAFQASLCYLQCLSGEPKSWLSTSFIG